jgi:signal transduction histidine kinase
MARSQGGGAALDDRDIEVLDTEIERLNELVQTFLDFARPPTPARSRVNLSDIVHRTLQLTKHRAERQDLQLEFEPSVPELIVNADPHQIQQVLLNLVLNAIDAQPNGGRVWIRLQASALSENETQVAILVGDSGPGIDSRVIDRIFEPFFSTKETGTGIGLAICQRIVEEHEGQITAENQLLGGALFTVLLPHAECILVTA